MTDKELVVIIDEESRSTLEDIEFRWFYGGKERKDKKYIIKTPIGDKKEIEGTLVKEPKLNIHTSEYLYLEITDHCNFACPHCGVGDELVKVDNRSIVYPGARYITDGFSSKLRDKIIKHPFKIKRKLLYSGGEPLLNPDEFKRIKSWFDCLEQTIHAISTNGCNLPLDFEKFREYMGYIGNPTIIFSFSTAHHKQYTNLARSGNGELNGKIPLDVKPEEAIFKKINIIAKHAKELDLGFLVNHVHHRKSKSYEFDGYLRDTLSEDVQIFTTTLGGYREPCSQGQETSIRLNGDMYPHCYDVFNRSNKIGVIGLLLE